MSILTSNRDQVLNLRAGEMVEIRSKAEILATLDANGTKDALPFMPEMLQFAGKRLRVFKRGDKACDTIGKSGSRRMGNAVHLDGVRCDGSAHGGCQAGCLIYWKEAWLKRVPDDPQVPSTPQSIQTSLLAVSTAPSSVAGPCTEETLCRATRRPTEAGGDAMELFSCQATELRKATSPLAWWDPRQYVRDITSRNIGISELTRGASFSLFNIFMRRTRQAVLVSGHWLTSQIKRTSLEPAAAVAWPVRETVSFSPPSRQGLMDRLKQAVDTLLVERPHVRGGLDKTPATFLDLQPGERVQVKSKDEIVATLDRNNKNRGLLFDVEMVPFCGGTYRVLRRVERIVDEKTGRMLKLPNPCVILDSVVCGGCLSSRRLFCPRSIYPYWHEIWLKRLP
jgi:hypothetical protein